MPLDSVGETLVALEREKWKRWNKDHFTWVENVLADEHLSIDATGGGVVERREALKKSPTLEKTVVTESHLTEFRILHPTSDTAVVTYKAPAKAVIRGREHPLSAYCTSVGVKPKRQMPNDLLSVNNRGETLNLGVQVSTTCGSWIWIEPPAGPTLKKAFPIRWASGPLCRAR